MRGAAADGALAPLDTAPAPLSLPAGGSATIAAVTPPRPTPPLLRAWRATRLGLHLVEGILTVLLFFPLRSAQGRRGLRKAWSHRLLALLGVHLRVDGAPVAPGSLLVANHISWLDIFTIHALAPSAFVSKAEVRAWPLAGWLAGHNETVFLRRGSRGHAKTVNGEIASILETGGHVAVFPEGTTTDGSQVLHFHGALLQPALDAAHPVQPLALSYHDATGQRTTATAYVGETSFGECLAAILAERRLEVRIQVLPSHAASAETGRRALSNACRAAILNHLGLPDETA